MFYSLDSDDDGKTFQESVQGKRKVKSISGSFRKKHAPTQDVKLEEEDA